jgi:hypothetical protein
MAMPEEPKKVTGGAFGRFLNEKRAELTEELKGKPASEVVKLASERFKALSEEGRASYEKKYKLAVEQYEKDLNSFLAAGGEKKAIKKKEKKSDEKKASRVKKQTDPDAPKKPVGGAYGIFSNEKREEFTKVLAEKGEKGFGPVAKMTSEAFKALSDVEKSTYEQKYAQKVAEYKEAYASYAAKIQAESPTTSEESPVAKRSRKANDTPPKPTAKRGRKAVKETTVDIEFEADVVAAAEKSGLLANLTNLARRPDVASRKFPPMDLLKALQENDGLVNKTKAALLGA